VIHLMVTGSVQLQVLQELAIAGTSSCPWSGTFTAECGVQNCANHAHDLPRLEQYECQGCL
jgi:hypothetical protein